ncbi:hypothetical protein RB608_09040 [Nocardioides sp. LHD-245]|uniref:hypothetical protein n=1 Tax=Nocardioides sp. LHD-245 TaxID=3051387 RepID=UPI0027DFA316|nr:hypothetical protein [Nocardioides sp. LHD-245]
MTSAAASAAADQALAGRIATLMRVGTAGASALLVAGACLRPAGATGIATVLLGSGCGLLVLLPVLRLVLMAGHFARLAERSYATISLVVLALVIAAVVVGVMA